MNQPLFISAIICTHNPKKHLLERVVSAIRAQDFPSTGYELLVIDNRSAAPLNDNLVSWHPRGRIVLENEIGLTHARLRGIRCSTAELIIFIDDDNILEPDYFSSAAAIAATYGTIGAFAGSTIPEFEVRPPKSILPYIEYLACSEVHRDYWGNFDWKWATPSGAGLCVRRSVAERYAKVVANDPLRTALGRTGTRLTSGEDHDLSLTATDMGLGIGRFCRLRLTHVIARERLTEEYIIRLYAGIGQCTKVLEAVRPHFKRTRGKLESVRFWWQLLRGPTFTRRLLWSRRNAEREATRTLNGLVASSTEARFRE